MKPLEISPNFTIEDIHKIREYNYEMTKNMTKQEKMDYYNEGAREVQRILQEMKNETKQTQIVSRMSLGSCRGFSIFFASVDISKANNR